MDVVERPHFSPCLPQALGMLDVVPVVAKVIRVPRQRFVAALPVQYHLDTVLRRRPHQLVAHQRSKRVYGLVLKPEHLLNELLGHIDGTIFMQPGAPTEEEMYEQALTYIQGDCSRGRLRKEGRYDKL